MPDIVFENIRAERWVAVRPRFIMDDHALYDFWSNDMGWVDLESATFFDFDEIRTRNLPIGASWVPVRRAYGMSLVESV